MLKKRESSALVFISNEISCGNNLRRCAGKTVRRTAFIDNTASRTRERAVITLSFVQSIFERFSE